MATQDDLVTYEMRGAVALIGLNRAAKRNAISDRVILALRDAVRRAGSEAKAGVIFGHGAHFCAGLDLAEHAERSLFDGVLNSRLWHAAFDEIESGQIPWFSALAGAVVGGGFELAASTQVRVAERGAFLALPEGQRGIFVGGGGSVRIARLIGVARMTDMMLTGRSVDADTAERWNAVNYVVEPGKALETALDLASKAAGNAPFTNWAVINALPRIQDMARGDGLFIESFIASVATATPEAAERLRAFLDKKAARVAAPDEKA